MAVSPLVRSMGPRAAPANHERLKTCRRCLSGCRAIRESTNGNLGGVNGRMTSAAPRLPALPSRRVLNEVPPSSNWRSRHVCRLLAFGCNSNSKDLMRFGSSFRNRDFVPLARMAISALFLIPNFTIISSRRYWNIGIRQLIWIAARTGRLVGIALCSCGHALYSETKGSVQLILTIAHTAQHRQ